MFKHRWVSLAATLVGIILVSQTVWARRPRRPIGIIRRPSRPAKIVKLPKIVKPPEIIWPDKVVLPEVPRMEHGPDLVVEEIFFAPESIEAFDHVHIGAKIKNKGDQAADISCLNLSVGSDHYFNQASRTELEPGESKTFLIEQAYWLAQPGTHTIRAYADSYKVIREIYELNNTMTKSVTIARPSGGIDLSIERVKLVKRGIVEVGDRPAFQVWLQNNMYVAGTDNPAVKPVVLRVQCDDGQQRRLIVRVKSYQKQAVIRLPEAFGKAREFELTFTIDAGSTLAETNEGNNTYVYRQTVVTDRELPDLEVVEILLEPSEPSIFDRVRLGTRVRNVGDLDMPISIIQFLVNGDHFWGQGSRTELEAGESKEFLIDEVKWVAFPGTNTISVKGDSYNVVSEKNESNNLQSVVVSIPMPEAYGDEVYIKRVKPVMSLVEIGDVPEFEVMVVNPLSMMVRPAPQLGPMVLRGVSNSGQTHEMSIEVSQTEQTFSFRFGEDQKFEDAGYVHFTFTVDTANDVAEINEDNNTFDRNVQVLERQDRADLTVTELLFDPAEPVGGQETRVGARIKNIGTAAAPITIVDLSGTNYKWAYGVGTDLAVGEEKTFWVNREWTPLAGTKNRMSAKIDHHNVVSEKNERNNSLSVEITPR